MARIAARQHEIVTLDQLRSAGLTRQALATRVRRGTLHRVHHRVYAVGSGRLTPEGRWLAAVLACGPGAALSHQSAAGLWAIAPVLLSPVHVTVEGNRRSRPGLVVHRSRDVPVTTRNGIPVTTVARTLRDLPRVQREVAATRAVIDRLIGIDALDGPLLRSAAERRLHRQAGPPLANVVVEGRERDFVWPDERLVIEVDGPHHELPPERERDGARDEELRRAGWHVVRWRA